MLFSLIASWQNWEGHKHAGRRCVVWPRLNSWFCYVSLSGPGRRNRLVGAHTGLGIHLYANWIWKINPVQAPKNLVCDARTQCEEDEGPFWLSDDQSFEKLGELMNDNNGKLLGLYDELSMFLAQMNVCRGRIVTDSQQVSTFLQLYGSDQWIRRTGTEL